MQHVREVHTKLSAGKELRLRDLPLKRHERVFHERVPLPASGRSRIRLSTNGATRSSRRWLRRGACAPVTPAGSSCPGRRSRRRGSETSIEPVVEALSEAQIGGEGTETERYLRIAMLRFLLLQTHDWTDQIVERLLGEVHAPGADDDTMVHRILKELS